MTAFLIVATLLAAATAAFLARSLLRAPKAARASADELNAAVYRDQMAELDAQVSLGAISAEHHARAVEAVRRRLADELRGASTSMRNAIAARGTAAGVALGIVLGSAALYLALGNPAALAPRAPQAAAARDDAHGLQNEQIRGMVERLAARLAENPEDLNGWVMLARSYSAMGRFDEAARAYREAAKRAPADAPLLADYADVLAMAQGRSFDGEPDRLIARALQADPAHIKALALAGSSAFGRKEYARAVEHWTRIEKQVSADSAMGRSIAASIAQARALAGGAAPAARPAQLSGIVKVAPALAARVAPGDTLFIYARAKQGSRMPVAILRAPVGRWPFTFTLDDSTAMSPDARLSVHDEVALEARVSKTGAAAAAPGDLRGMLTAVKVGASGVILEITTVVE